MNPKTILPIFISLVLLAAVIIFAAGCKSDSTSTTPRTGTITQAELDNVTMRLDSGITGDDASNAFTAVNDTLTVKHKLRDLFASITKSTSVSEGDIFIRKAYYISSTSYPKRDSVINFVVMVKREAGYYPAGNDWEYIKIPYNATTDYKAHPFGLLPADTSTSTAPDLTKTSLRGRLQAQCATCHAGASGDFLFSR
ncbi:MAG: hypothetical protein Q8916_00095 [Bacteroidota bacterium]|nr:hypothetical protein [Bacteroidota bacterium]MDP4228786.1 hypothetical protein [Bacteroidota bacterium]